MQEETLKEVLHEVLDTQKESGENMKGLAKEIRDLKREVQEKQSQDIQECQKQISAVKVEIGTLKTGQQTLLQQISGPIKQLNEFGAKIDSHSELLKKPHIQKVVHEHHVPKLLYATVALFCICLCFGFGWFQTGQHLSQYRNNDTKWRKLLLGAKPILTEIMQDVSANVEQNPDNVRDSVEKEETHNAQVWDLQQKMKADSAVMRALKTDKPTGDNSSYIHKK